MKTVRRLLPLIALILCATAVRADDPVVVKWSDLQYSPNSTWIVHETSSFDTYYDLSQVYKIQLEKSTNDALLYFNKGDEVLRIDFGKINAKQKLASLLSHMNVPQKR